MSFSKSRCYGIDLLKIYAMLMIIVGHILTQFMGEISGHDCVVKFIKCFTCIAVNCYAMATGYLMIEREQKLSNLIQLWFQIVFYSIGISLIFVLLKPSGANIEIGITEIITMLFPISRNAWWYASSYFGLFLLMPAINKLIKSANHVQLMTYFIVTFVVTSVFPTITYGNGLTHGFGFSAVWLCIMYTVGAYIKLYKINHLKSKCYFWSHMIFNILVWIIILILDKWIVYPLLGVEKAGNLINIYISPTTVISSILLFLGFVSIKKTSKNKLVKRIAQATFGIYLIHTHDMIWVYFTNAFRFLYQYNVVIFVIAIMLIGIIIFVACGAIEACREKVFRICRIEKLSIFIAEKLQGLLRASAIKICEFYDDYEKEKK